MTSYCDYPDDETRCSLHDELRPCPHCYADEADRQHDTRKEQAHARDHV